MVSLRSNGLCTVLSGFAKLNLYRYKNKKGVAVQPTKKQNIMIKLFITDFKKIVLYGDGCAINKTTIEYPFRGRAIRVKILGLFWITYKYYTIK